MKFKRGLKKSKGFENKILAEQRFVNILGKNVFYKDTDIYKKMSRIEKIGFEKYLKNKRVALKFIVTVLLISFIFLIVKPELTGKMIGDIDYKVSSFALYLGLILVGLVIFFILFKKGSFNKRK